MRTTQSFADSKPLPHPADLFTGHDDRGTLHTSTRNSQSLGKYPDLTWSDPQTPYPNLIGINQTETIRLLPDNANPSDKKKLDTKLSRLDDLLQELNLRFYFDAPPLLKISDTQKSSWDITCPSYLSSSLRFKFGSSGFERENTEEGDMAMEEEMGMAFSGQVNKIKLDDK